MKSHFIERMTRHFGSRPCPKGLIESWHQLEHGVATAATQRQWQVIQWPTGSGKTEALIVLCASPEITRHPGALIVTRFTDEADEVARKINANAGSAIAVASHRKSPLTAQAMYESPVLVITHEAYRLALREACDNPDVPVRLNLYHRYWDCNRSWIFVDEAFNWIDTYEADLDEASAMCAALSVQIQRNANLDHLTGFIHHLANGYSATRSDGLLRDEHFALLASVDFEELRTLIKQAPADTIELWRNTELHLRKNDGASIETTIRRTTLKNEYVGLLSRLDAIKRIDRSWISQRRGRTRLHSSRLLLDTNRPCGVILDATANIDRTYDMLDGRIAILPRSMHIRSYKNVTVHVSRPHRVGKEYLAKHASTEWPVLVKRLSSIVSDQSDVLVVTQKNTKERIKSGPSCGKQVIGHWGDLDGKNEWKDCDTVVVFGLPYPDDIAPTDMFHACTGVWSDDWFAGKREYGGHADLKNSWKYGFIARSVIQAINRVHCRTIIDNEGNCAFTDVFILLPQGIVGDAVLGAIRSHMPGAIFAPWNALPEKQLSLTRSERRLISEVKRGARGKYTRTQLIDRLSITSRTFDRMSAKIRKVDSPLAQELAAIGAELRCTKGRGQEAHLIKH